MAIRVEGQYIVVLNKSGHPDVLPPNTTTRLMINLSAFHTCLFSAGKQKLWGSLPCWLHSELFPTEVHVPQTKFPKKGYFWCKNIIVSPFWSIFNLIWCKHTIFSPCQWNFSHFLSLSSLPPILDARMPQFLLPWLSDLNIFCKLSYFIAKPYRITLFSRNCCVKHFLGH